MTDENYVLGAWNPLFPNTIYFKPMNKSYLSGNKFKDKFDYDFYYQQILPTIIHELYHKYQAQTFTILLYSLLAIPFWRNYTIENSAYDISDQAEEIMIKIRNDEYNNDFLKLNVEFYRIKF